MAIDSQPFARLRSAIVEGCVMGRQVRMELRAITAQLATQSPKSRDQSKLLRL